MHAPLAGVLLAVGETERPFSIFRPPSMTVRLQDWYVEQVYLITTRMLRWIDKNNSTWNEGLKVLNSNIFALKNKVFMKSHHVNW